MGRSLKVGIMAIVVTAVVVGGIAIALDDGTPPSRPGAGPLAGALSPLVDDGTLNQAQADAVVDVLTEHFAGVRDRLADRPPPGARLDDVAEFLGMTVEEVRSALADGSTLSEIAEGAGVTTDALVDHIVARARTRLAAAVADGRIDQASADERLAEIIDRVTAMVAGEFPGGSGLEGRHPGRYGPDGGPCPGDRGGPRGGMHPHGPMETGPSGTGSSA